MTFSAGTMTAISWAQPNIDQSAPDDGAIVQGAKVSATGLEHPWYATTVEWSWPNDAPWTEFAIVRSIRSPAIRVEEGQIMVTSTQEDWDHYNPETGRPIYQDPQPPPGEWTFYSVFCLNVDRIWEPAGSVAEIGPANNGWTLRLPELLPGAAVTNDQGVVDPAQQSNDLVQFLQSPAGYLDRAVSMGETMQYFWDPRHCPPQMVPHLAASWGYGDAYSETLGLGRVRAVLATITDPTLGSLEACRRFVEGASGCLVDAQISNNLMLNVNDSSFESGDIYDSGWEPIYSDPLNEATKLEIRSTAGQTLTLPPNVQYDWYLYIPDARTIKCGSYTVVDEAGDPVLDGDSRPTRMFDPICAGIPVSGWENIRMGIHAHEGLTPGDGGSTTLEMGIDLYDYQGIFLQSLTVLQQRTITDQWAEYYNGDGLAADDDGVPMPSGPPDPVPTDYMTNTGTWEVSPFPDHETPQAVAPTVQSFPDEDAMVLNWDPAAAGSTGIAAQVVTLTDITVGASYTMAVRADAAEGDATWRAVVLESTDGGSTWVKHEGPTVTPDGSNDTSLVVVTAVGSDMKLGLEVDEPGTGWGDAGTHAVTYLAVVREEGAPAYGVPWVTVGNACSVDLVVVDDGLVG